MFHGRTVSCGIIFVKRKISVDTRPDMREKGCADKGRNEMGYPDNFDGAACDSAQGEPVDYDQPLLARVKAVQHAA
ncbi:hypothetical protein GW813_08200, partial [bacterium]|nr:hypothetical protein [bacterium]